MASKQTYECYVCKRNGFVDVRVYLDGKTEDGRTIYKNPDMSAHIHKISASAPKQQTQQQTQEPVTQQQHLERIEEKLDRLLNLVANQIQKRQ